MVHFGEYLKDYLEYYNISQSEFASRLGVTQKHMNEIINGKTSITLEMAATIERLTGISSKLIVSIENANIIQNKLLKQYGSEDEIKRMLKEEYHFNELKKLKWVNFKDETNTIQNSIDILDFLKVKDFETNNSLMENVLFKKSGEDSNKLALWIAHCDKISESQHVGEYVSSKFDDLIYELKEYAYKEGLDVDKIKEMLNKYGIIFVCEKALPGTKVRGCFRVKLNTPAIYITKNYLAKDSFYFELFHELGHCKSDYNKAKSKTIIDGDDKIEQRADEFAIKTMVNDNVWDIISKDTETENLLSVSKRYKIPMSFIVGRLAKVGKISYRSRLYNEYKEK